MKTLMDQTQKMYPFDCTAVAGTAINLLKSGLNKSTKKEMVTNLNMADDLVKSEKFEWGYVSDDLFHEFDRLFDQLLDKIQSL